MDLATIGTAVSIAIISNLTQKATEEENIGKIVDWVLSVGEYFWKTIKKKSTIVEPPPSLSSGNEFTETPMFNVDDFTTKRKMNQVVSLMEQLNIYSSNLNKDLERAAKVGGIDSPDMSHRLYNSIQDQKKAITQCFLQLSYVTSELYGRKVQSLEQLIKDIETNV